MLRIPQGELAGEPVDSVDRVIVGSSFVRELVEAGL